MAVGPRGSRGLTCPRWGIGSEGMRAPEVPCVATADPGRSADPVCRPHMAITVHDSVLDLDASALKQRGRCPRRLGERLNERTGELYPNACWASSCPRCVGVQTARRRAALRYVAPEWLLTLTNVGDSWREVSNGRKVLHQRMRRRGYQPRYAWVIECGSSGPAHHLHALGWGSVPNSVALAEEAAAVGWGHVVDVRPVTSPNVAGYLTKQAVNSGGHLEHYLDMNGGRLLQATNGFWRAGADGPSITGGLRGALREMRDSR